MRGSAVCLEAQRAAGVASSWISIRHAGATRRPADDELQRGRIDGDRALGVVVHEGHRAIESAVGRETWRFLSEDDREMV